MKLADVLKECGNKDFDMIEYRSIQSIDSDDVDTFMGLASYKNKMLVSLDGDSYYLSDNVVKYEVYRPNWLIVYV